MGTLSLLPSTGTSFFCYCYNDVTMMQAQNGDILKKSELPPPPKKISSLADSPVFIS